MPSSPNGPCSSGKTTSTSPSVARQLARLEHGQRAVARCSSGTTTPAPLAVDLGQRGPAVSSSGSGSSAASTQRPSRGDADRHDVVRVAVDAPAARSAAVAQQTACSRGAAAEDEGDAGAAAGRSGLGLSACSSRAPYRCRRSGLVRCAGAAPSLCRGRPAPPSSLATARRHRRPPAARRPDAAVNAPVELTSTYVADGPVDYGYGRWTTRRGTAFEEALGALEGGRRAGLRLGHGGHRRGAVDLVPDGGASSRPTHAYNGTA